ncbi:FMR1-interacting protein NUFIP1 [Hetaerina americana]|uniref:FMR1-interacting protein NUFIP1 n=1 Tax=Hetaerina americana TaxID=62018 RepID=UPI003A7F2816
MSSNFGQHISYPRAGCDYGSTPVCPEMGSSRHGFQNYQLGWNNSQGSLNMGYFTGPAMMGPPLKGGRPMRGRSFGGGGRFNGPARPQSSSSGDYYCDSCERGFMTPGDLQHHLQNDHIVCGLEGCTLSAHPKIVEKHQRMQHDSGLYSRLAGVSSQKPEDVQKWINDRKKNYPTKENIDRRKQEEEECLKRGESLGPFRGRGSRFGRQRGRMNQRGRGFGRGGQSWQDNGPHEGRGFRRGMHQRKFNGRGGRHQRQMRGRQSKKMSPGERLPHSMDDEPREIPMFQGTAYLLGVTLEKSPSSGEEQENLEGTFSDSEWVEEKQEEEKADTKGSGMDDPKDKEGNAAKNNAIMLNNALGSLMGNYASDNSDDDDPPVEMKTRDRKEDVPTSNDGPKEGKLADPSPALEEKAKASVDNCLPEAAKDKDEGEESDGSAPEEVAIVRVEVEGEKGSEEVGVAEGPKENIAEGVDEGKRTRRSRKRARGKGEDSSKEKAPDGDVKRPQEKRMYTLPPRHPTLLEELLKNEIRHERNVILQCIRFVMEKKFFDPEPMVGVEKENTIEREGVENLTAGDDGTVAVSDASAEKCSEMNA